MKKKISKTSLFYFLFIHYASHGMLVKFVLFVKKILHYILMFFWFRYADSINKKISRGFQEFSSLPKKKYWCSKLTQKILPPHGMQMDIFAFFSGRKWIRVLVFFLDFSNEIVMLFSSKMLTYIFG